MEQIKTIEDIKQSRLFGNSNFDNIINGSMQVLSDNPELVTNNNMDIGDTPISPMLLDDDYTPILFSEDVMQAYKVLVEKINIPDTAKEYSFVILGKSGMFAGDECYVIDKLIDCSLPETKLSNRVTEIDQEKLNQVLRYAIKNGYDFISIGHTHPNIPEEERTITIANYLPEDVKMEEYIREAGLNLSLQDFISYESLYQYFLNNPNIRTGQVVIMFNGEMAVISKKESKLNRFTVLMDMTNGEEIYVSSKDEFDKDKSNTL